MYEGYLLNLRKTTNPALVIIEKNFELDTSEEDVIPWVISKVETKKYCLTLEQNLGGKFMVF